MLTLAGTHRQQRANPGAKDADGECRQAAPAHVPAARCESVRSVSCWSRISARASRSAARSERLADVAATSALDGCRRSSNSTELDELVPDRVSAFPLGELRYSARTRACAPSGHPWREAASREEGAHTGGQGFSGKENLGWLVFGGPHCAALCHW